ncbi:MAG: peptidoglycan-binding protein, partial [bacterium]|nr:peptidoglycan-binding protein [bacterium]
MATLKLGSQGDDVAALQRRLNELGFNAGAADGIFGGGTRAAVEQFQQSRNLRVDGIVGPATAEALGLLAEAPSPIVEVTPQVVKPMFPATNINNIRQNLPPVLQALVDDSLADQKMVLMALATIRAETASFRPISEGQSKYNTEPGGEPFGMYNNREDLGNLGSPDGAN